MVSAVSSQAATLNPLAYMAQTDDDTSKQAAPDATANDTDRGPATVVSLSQAIQDFSAAGLQWGQDRMAEVQARSAEIHKQFAINPEQAAAQEDMQKSFAAAQADMQNNVTVWLKNAQDTYDRWQNATPVPAVQLNDTQIADVLKKAAKYGYDPSKIGGADTYGFGMNGKIYIFKKDGTAWMNDDGVPTSEQQKQDVLATVANNIQFLTGYLQNTDAAAPRYA